MLENELQEAGLTRNEAILYLASLEMGRASILELSKKTHINRSTIYILREDLVKRGLLNEIRAGKKRLLLATTPEYIKEILKNRLKKIDSILPQLLSLSNTKKDRPVLKYFDGLEGIKEVYRASLKSADSALVGFTGFSVLTDYSKALEYFWEKEYVPERKKAGKLAKLVIPDNKIGHDYKEKNSDHFRETKFVPASTYNFEIDFFVFDNKVAFVACNKNEEYGVLIESNTISKTIRMIWQTVWNVGY